jgi:EpsD family peptidyl-prolyl cis-trans isomerase
MSIFTAGLVLGLSACGNQDDKNENTEVAAKVGTEEILVRQINQVTNRISTTDTSPQLAQAMNREVLEKLIDQQLAVEQATDKKLNRSFKVVSQIEAARSEILARAYMQLIASAVPKPTAEELKKYYAEHPQLFSERRIFNVQEIVVPTAAGVADHLRQLIATGKSIEEATVWLKGKDIKFDGGNATRTSEQIPLELLTQIHALQDGQSVVIDTPQTITLLRLTSSQLSPVTEATALPRIEQFLVNQRADEAVAANLKQLRANTKISYMGDYAKPETEPAASITISPSSPVTQPAADVKTNTALAKGVVGLK